MDPEVKKEVNILLLGETGVGKSTWINGMTYYFHFDSLDAVAENAKRKAKSKQSVPNNQLHEVLNESTWTESTTQDAYKRSFEKGNTVFSFIDTPGFGDSRGIEQDRLHIQDILERLRRQASELHGICILLNQNSFRFQSESLLELEYCLKEMLSPFHRKAAANIAFCFTNAKATPNSETLTNTLKSLLTNFGLSNNFNRTGQLTEETIYYLDNSVVSYISALKKGESFTEAEHFEFNESWNSCVKETERLAEYFSNLEPHNTKYSDPLTFVRQAICKLAKIPEIVRQNIDSEPESDRQGKQSQYEEELETILEVSSKFGAFLKENALVIYNDVVLSYVDLLIEYKLNENEDENQYGSIEELTKMKQVYLAEENILVDAIQNLDDNERIVSWEELMELTDGFRRPREDLQLTGEMVLKIFAEEEH